MKAPFLVAFLLCAGCASSYHFTYFEPMRGSVSTPIGAGTVLTVDGMEVWTTGEPDRTWHPIGRVVCHVPAPDHIVWIQGWRPSKAIVAEARKQGADAVICYQCVAGQWAYNSGMYALAIQYTTAANHSTPESSEIDNLLKEGRVALANTNSAHATEVFQRVTVLDPSLPAGWVGVGAAYMFSRDFPAALFSYKTAIHLDSNNASAWLGLAATYHVLKQDDLSKQAFEKLRAIDPAMAEYEKSTLNSFNIPAQTDSTDAPPASMP